MIIDSPVEREKTSDSPEIEMCDQESPSGEEVSEVVSESSLITALEAERDDLKDRLLRAVAETDNTRRRAVRDVTDARHYAISAFARDAVTAADNIQRALAFLDNGEKEKLSPSLKAFVEGIELTERDFLTTLERHGVKKVDPQGQKFDPHFHQAMFEVENDSLPAGTVAQVVQIGFVIGDRVLRPALVGVSKGGPKTELSSANEMA
jgi:molecular chaperone GrpE